MWRGFIRMKTLGSKGLPNIRAIKAEFESAPEEELRLAAAMGRAATQRHRTQKGFGSAFGLGPQQQRRQRQRMLREALWARYARLPEQERLQAIANRSHLLGESALGSATTARAEERF